MTDEPECHGLPEDKRRFLRVWADVYHQYNSERKVYVNHCDPEWYDLNEKHVTCSTAPTITVNSHRITDRINAARSTGLEQFYRRCAAWTNVRLVEQSGPENLLLGPFSGHAGSLELAGLQDEVSGCVRRNDHGVLLWRQWFSSLPVQPASCRITG